MAQTQDHRGSTVLLPPSSGRRPRPRPRTLIIVGGVILVAAWAFLAVRTASGASSELETGRAHLERARAVLLEGNVPEAAGAFRAAERAFAEAEGRTRSPSVSVARWIPIAGRTPDALLAVAESGRDVARAGLRITRAIEGLPGGISALGPQGGRVDSGPFAALAPALREAAALTETARERVEDIPTLMVPGAVVEARLEALGELRSLEAALDSAAGLIQQVPELLGHSSPSRFFVGAQNPAELRGTGGLIGAYSILEVDDGRFSFTEFDAIQNLRTFRPDEVEAPNPDYAEHYNRFGGAGFWLNINMTPDLPAAAEAIATTYAKATGEQLDGVLLADPFAIQALLEFTGPLEVPRFGEVDAETVVGFVSNRAYAQFTDQELRKAVLGDTALTVLDAFLHRVNADTRWVRTLAEALGQGHLKLWSADPRVQAALDRAGVAGSIAPPTGSDFLSLVQNNGGGNKLDYYLDREIRYTVRLRPSGTAEATVAIRLRNRAPAAGLPRYVIGPYPGVSEAGENVSYATVYCPAFCELRRALRDGEPVEVYAGTELGARLYRDYVRIPSGEEAAIRMDLALADAWVPEGGGGLYRLEYLDQQTIRPTRLTVTVIPPEGAEIASVSDGVRVEDGRAVWSGDPRRVERFQVVFG